RSHQFFQFRSRLLQPVRHAHRAIHRRRCGEMLLRLLALARAPVERAEAEVAVGGERVQPESGTRGHSLESHLPLSLTSSKGAEKMYRATRPIPDSSPLGPTPFRGTFCQIGATTTFS